MEDTTMTLMAFALMFENRLMGRRKEKDVESHRILLFFHFKASILEGALQRHELKMTICSWRWEWRKNGAQLFYRENANSLSSIGLNCFDLSSGTSSCSAKKSSIGSLKNLANRIKVMRDGCN